MPLSLVAVAPGRFEASSVAPLEEATCAIKMGYVSRLYE